MPFVSITQSPRDPETNRRLITAITKSFVDICGVSPDRISIHLVDVDPEHWADGGTLVADRLAAATPRSTPHQD